MTMSCVLHSSSLGSEPFLKIRHAHREHPNRGAQNNNGKK